MPLPGVQLAISRHLQRDRAEGLQFAGEVARNPHYRPAAQRALQPYVHTQSHPLHLLYQFASSPEFDTYLIAPIAKQDWQNLPTTGQVLLGEIGGLTVNSGTEWQSRTGESLINLFTRFRRDRRTTRLTRFAHFLYDLYDHKAIDSETFALSQHRDRYASLTTYPGGPEIVQSFDAFSRYLTCTQISNIPTSLEPAIDLPANEIPIRPTVLQALDRLHAIGLEVRTYETATSRVNKLAAIARATDSLDTLDSYVSDRVYPPEQFILKRIIRQWRALVSEAGGEAGRAVELKPIANPYVAGNPVTGALFVGRKDHLTRLEEYWMKSGVCPSVVLYGHRRMGKSSILKNLDNRFGPQTTIVDFNMQLAVGISSTGELLYDLALAIHDSLANALETTPADTPLNEPTAAQFQNGNPYTSFKQWLKQLDRVRGDRRFIITIDEFELIEQKMHDGKLDPGLLDFWRGLIQTYPWFILAFAGLHTLGEMTENYWNPLFGSVTAIQVSFLSRAATEKLIVQPTPDFDIDYDPEAIQLIYQLAHGQPYLTQLICQTLVTRFNRQIFEDNIERDRLFTRADVTSVINTPDFYRDGNAYFTGVWGQAETTAPPGQHHILKLLSQTPLTPTQLSERSELTGEGTRNAIATLENHDVITRLENGTYTYTVELMRNWVAQNLNTL